MISAIVAVDNNWGIGFEGQLLECIPEDMRRFKQLTTGHVVIMGRKTWDSLPSRPLPNRINYVITKEARVSNEKVAYFNMDCIKMTMQKQTNYDYFVIGGGEIYKQLLPYCDRVYVTKIFTDHENIDTYFPNLDNDPMWQATDYSDIKTFNNKQYQFITYKRV